MNNTIRNPFETHSETKLITLGSFVTLVFSIIAYMLYTRFDGLIDMHFSNDIRLMQPLLDNTVNIIACSVFLFALGKYINPKTRFVDILAASIIARIPMYPLLLLNINGYLQNNVKVIVENSTSPEAIQNIPTDSLIVLLVFALLAIGALIWYMILLYRGFKTATNSKGSKPVALFIITILLIEITTKFLIHLLNY